VSKEKKGKIVDARCRDLTNTAAVNKARAEPGSVEVCNFHEVRILSVAFRRAIIQGGIWKNMSDIPHENILTPGIWTLADILQHGRDSATCPYFAIRRSVCPHLSFPHIEALICDSKMPFVDVIIYSFHYLLDPKVAEQVSKEMSKDSIVVFDEAHNIGA